jgi:hypothetical protein
MRRRASRSDFGDGNTIGIATADDDTAYGFQIQPVYSLRTDDTPYNRILRSVPPVVGAPVGAELPGLGDEAIKDRGRKWGRGAYPTSTGGITFVQSLTDRLQRRPTSIPT